MSELMEFIGREAEISFIEAQIKQTETRVLVFVRGEGGLGKTRLLQEIRKRYVNKDEFLTADIIDFDDRSLHTFEGIEIRIAKELGIAGQVAEEIRELRLLRSSTVDQRSLEEKQNDITTLLSIQFNHLSKNKRLLFFFDTTEKIGEDNLRGLLSLLSRFENGFFLFAGRHFTENSEVDISQLMQSSFDGDVTPKDLDPLNMDNSREYFRAKLDELHNVKDERVENLLKLVDGRPILIELTAQWLSIAPTPDWLSDELVELESLPDEGFVPDEDFRQKQKDFQVLLVHHITQLRNPLDQLLLVLSRVYPIDAEMVEELLTLSRGRAEELMGNAKEYVFVKTLPGGKITLHDEMRRMINDLVWRDIDKSKEWRRRDSKKASAIFERRVSEQANHQNEEDVVRSTQYSDEWRRIEYEVLVLQWVEHALYADTDSGLDIFTNAWNRAANDRDFDFSGRILKSAGNFSKQFNRDQRFHYFVLDARQKNRTGGDFEDTKRRFRELEKEHAGEQDDLSAIYNTLGMAERKSGSMQVAIDYFRKNLGIIQKTNPSLVPLVANQLGYTYRLMGNLKMAERNYQKALKLAMEAEEQDKDLIASLFNNLGYVFGLRKQYDIAENYCSLAADIWSKMGLTSQLGRVDISLGIFQRDRGNYEEAINLLNRAVERVRRSSNFEVIGLAYYHLAWAKWFKWEEINKSVILDWDETKKIDDFIEIELLLESKKDFDFCLDIAENRGATELLPGILHEMSYVYWWFGWLQDEQYKSKARELNTRAYLESEKRDNIRYAIESIVGDAEFDYDEREYSKIQEYAAKLETSYGKEEMQYLLFFGRTTRILGDVTFLKGQYNEALMHYTEALPKIQRHGGYGKYSTQRELQRLERKLDKLSLAEVNIWLDHFQTEWGKKAELLHWCEKERLRAKLE